MKSNIIYRPLTATPFNHSAAYKEIEPCRMLQSYVRCFWTGEYNDFEAEGNGYPEVVIPDTCVDIIYRVDDTDHTVTADFSGINDRSFYVRSSGETKHKISVFAIRFYAWSAYVFSEDSFKGTVNGKYDVRERFAWLDREVRGRIFEAEDLTDMIQLIERLLVKKLEASKKNDTVDRAVNHMLLHYGALEINQLAKESFTCVRQLERLFQEYIGITPKKLSNMVRYQFLWRDIVSKDHFDIMNAVCQYGYTDAAHLMREFKRYHSMNIRDARRMAFPHKIADAEFV
ncbi:AraC family transcriptional regulator [Lachnospiraceae bacterium 64-25]